MGWCICAPCFNLLVTRHRRLCTHLGNWGFMRRGFSLFINPTAFATLVGPNKGETAVCGCHCPRDIAVRMSEVLARPWVCVCVPLALSLLYFQCNRIKLNLFSSNTVFHDISKIQQRALIGKTFARWHLAIAITSRGYKSSHLR